MNILAPSSPVHNLRSRLAFSTKTTPACGDWAREQASSQDLDYCAELITASALNGLHLERSSRRRQCHAQLGRMSLEEHKCENIFGEAEISGRSFFCSAKHLDL